MLQPAVPAATHAWGRATSLPSRTHDSARSSPKRRRTARRSSRWSRQQQRCHALAAEATGKALKTRRNCSMCCNGTSDRKSIHMDRESESPLHNAKIGPRVGSSFLQCTSQSRSSRSRSLPPAATRLPTPPVTRRRPRRIVSVCGRRDARWRHCRRLESRARTAVRVTRVQDLNTCSAAFVPVPRRTCL